MGKLKLIIPLLLLSCLASAQTVACPNPGQCIYGVTPSGSWHFIRLDASGNISLANAVTAVQNPTSACPTPGACPYAVGASGTFQFLQVDPNGNLLTTASNLTVLNNTTLNNSTISAPSFAGAPMTALGWFNPSALPLTGTLIGSNIGSPSPLLSSAQGGSGTVGRTTLVTSNTSLSVASTTSFYPSPLVLPALAPSTTGVGRCFIPYQQLTGASTVTFAINNSVAPTNEWVSTVMEFNATAGVVPTYQYTTDTAQGQTAITAANTMNAAATTYYLQVDFGVSNAATAPLVISIWGKTGSVSDAIQINAGAYCAWL